MKSFVLSLSNGAQVSGIVSPAPSTVTTSPYRPLIVGLHGGTYTSSYFNAGTATSVVRVAEQLGIPFIAIDRPGYQSSTALPPISEGQNFLREEGKYLHKHILPEIWKEYGPETGANTIVILAHSLGAAGTIVAAALHATADQPEYPLGGLIMSGWGTVHARPQEQAAEMIKNLTVNGRINWPLEHKDVPMFGVDPGERALRVSPEILAMTAELDHSMSAGEITDATFTWLDYWLDYAKGVKVPIMYGMGEHDALWKTTKDNVEAFAQSFTSSPRVERGVVLEAPHCIELSYWGPGWTLRCLGFSIECACAEGVKMAKA